ncbi:MAG: ATP-binding protein [Oscillospiraceae bacterium]|nr:ATP-binding protein [Oscillospiraceae bacterium]
MFSRKSSTNDSAIAKKLFQKAMLTMLVAELSGAVTAIIDGILTGRYLGSAALAACGLGAPYYSIASIISGILMVGNTRLCTKAIGAGNRKELTGVFSLTMSLAAVLAGLLAFAGILFPGVFASLFGAGRASSEVFSDTASYLRGLFIGAPGFILYVVLTPVLQLDGDSLRPRIASFVCALTDVVADLLNIFVFHGGVFGMAIASSVSHYAALLIVLSHFLKPGSMFRFSAGEIKPAGALPLLKDGLPRAVCMLCRAILPVMLNALILRLVGDAGVTAYSAMNSTTFLVGSLGWGIGGAVLIMGGMMAGEEDVTGLKAVIRTALGDILAGVSALALIVFICAPHISSLFIPQGGSAKEMASAAIRCYAVCLPFLAFNVSTANYLQSVSRIIGANLVNIGIEAAFTAVMAYALSPLLGISGVWLAFPLGQALLSITILLRVLLLKGKSKRGTEALMLLPKGFGIPEENRLELSPATIEEVTGLSEKAYAFCLDRGISPSNSNKLALCVEEMAGNVIEHGFNDGKPHHMDVRVLVKGDTVILRLRDDCRHFDLREKVKKWTPDPEHPEKYMGIRLVLQMARDIAYTNTMNTNNLIITI